MSDATVVYVTHRPVPRFDWFADSLAAQLGDDDPEVIFVDGLHSDERAAELEQVVRSRFAYRHIPAKPTPWNGPYRLTQEEYFAAASARNTGIVYATKAYVVFVDDCAVLMPGWWQEARAAAEHGYVVGGAFQKHHDMVVEGGSLLSSNPIRPGLDVRWERGEDAAIVRIGGGELFGCSFGAPRELLIRVNGADELCDPIGEVDCQLGIRLELAGADIFYSRRMLTVESMGQYQQPLLKRLWRTLEPDVYTRRLRELGVTRRSRDDGWDNLCMVYDLLYGTHSTRSLGNYYDLEVLTEAGFEATIGRFPSEYWFDGTPLADL